MSDVFIDGTDLPAPPNCMSKEASYMAYDQLKGMRFGNGHEAAQKVYEAAQKELTQEQETKQS